MNSLGAGLVWSGVQVSLLVLAGGFVYALLRRRGPALGSVVALALLVIAIGLPILSLAPWPNWWRLHVVAATTADRAAAEKAESADATMATPTAADARGSHAASSPNSAGADETAFDATTWARTFWKNLWGGLGDRPTAESAAAYRWPSVAAWLLLAGMGLGLTRLALGLAAVRAYRRRTRPVTDQELVAILDAMRTRLGCQRPIELRESAEIAAPATVGWRRPLILLPPQWREWSEGERRVVLAHEVAHVGRGDIAGWFVAQFSVVLHFYNPLVHWLARRLRIEQELAADAWGAMAAGGSGPYLTTLAGMALRQDDRVTTWAARPFLPARGTLLRRIEMLRDKKQLQTFTFSLPKQIVLWSVLATLGLFIAGLRGPGGESVATAQTAPPGGQATGIFTANQPIDLAYVPDDSSLVVAVRPADIMKSDAGKLLAQAANQSSMKLEETLGLPISEVEYVKLTINELRSGAPSRIIVRATKAHDWAKFAATIVHDPVEVESTIAAAAGKKFFKSGKTALHTYPAGAARCYFLADDRTVIFAPEQEMPLVIAAMINPEPEPKWAKTWQAAATGNLAVMLDVERLRKLVEPELKRGSGGSAAAITAMIGPLWQDSQRLFVGTDIAEKNLGLFAIVECPSEEAAGRVQQTTQALVTMALNGLAEVRKVEMDGPGDDVAIKKTLLSAAEELLKQAQVTREGSKVVVQSHGTGATLLAAASIALPAIQKTRDAAGRAQSMNNLKQLALAMHMYHETHGRLPPAVVMGPDGKTPHSWRVELLPYLDQKALFDQYKMDQPWDSPANKKVSQTKVAMYLSPGGDDRRDSNADYFVLTGKGTLFPGKEGMRFTDITGGTSGTIMIVEAKRDIPWTKPEDIDYDPSQPLPKLGGHFPGIFCAAFADGSVRAIADGAEEKTLRAQISPNADDKLKLDQGSAPPVRP